MNSKKKLILVIFLVVGGGAAAYLWATQGLGRVERDPTAMERKQKFKCAKCNNEWELTIADVVQQRKDKGDIICPKCGQGEAIKENVKIDLGGTRPRSFSNADKEEPAKTGDDQPVEGKPKLSAPGKIKK